jgi:phosphoenolpyruvate-protein kinase (PTS system EI component)
LADAAAAHLDKVQLCGVLAQLPGVLRILLGLGYRTFSVEAALLPHLADSVRRAQIADCRRLAARVCAAKESHEVLELMGLEFSGYRPFVA